MKSVWKYPLKLNDENQPVMLPVDSKVVLVDVQGGTLCLWAEIEQTYEVADPTFFRVFGTGHDIPDGYTHVGSCQMGPFVWHVYNIGTVRANR